jgi:hypothetical protein
MKTAKQTAKQTALIASVGTYVASKWEYSHAAGAMRIFSQQLDAAGIAHDVLYTRDESEWDQYEHVILWQGLELGGKLNVNTYGTLRGLYARKLRRLANYRGKLSTAIYPLVDLTKLRDKDWGPEGNAVMTTSDWSKLEGWYGHRSYPYLIDNPNPSKHLCVGDSHILAAWLPQTHLRIHSGMTMHGAVERGLSTLIGTGYDSATFYFGNIDLRHHVCRMEEGFESVLRHLVFSYVHQLLVLPLDQIELVAPLPIESPERQIPKPGWYKGQPFWGSWECRNAARGVLDYLLHEACAANNWSYFEWPDEWTLPNGELDQAVMERPRSVHVAPKFYRSHGS